MDGIVRAGFFLGYILLISQMKDMKKVFQYHGAEHCSVHCYEAGKRLTPENAIKFTTLHPRCGTSFLVIVIIVSIVVFSFISSPNWYFKLMSRILLIPVIAGLSYEVLKFSAKYEKYWIFKLLIAPGLWTQKITTKKPSKKQVEVAIAALKKVI